MRCFVASLLLPALLLAGCAEVAPLPTPSPRPIAISDREPGPACRLLQAVEVRSGAGDEPAHVMLGDYAAQRRASYVTIDTFTVLEEPEESVVVLRARLFCCPPPRAALVARAR